MSNMIPASRVNGYRIPDTTIDGIGNWDGQERLAMQRFYRLLEVIAETMPAAAGETIDAQEDFERIADEAWSSWGSEAGLLTATDEQFRTWARAHVA